ncbi:hypothetical protein GGS21DRAFT_306946 [Xylaria nigripes]|nr:hypothetical protein GGS21DRAFT_306946 [Xylaria nigripes]
MDSSQFPIEEQPPPYSAHAINTTSTQELSSATSHLQHHFSSLPTRIRKTREIHSIQQSLDDTSLLDLLIPAIETFLSHLSNTHPIPPRAYLKLVPAAAIPPNATLSGLDEMRQRGEHCQVVRVSLADEKKGQRGPCDSGQDWSAGREFSDWGRFGDSAMSESARDMLWWRDEDMAQRLASHLRPATVENEPPVLETLVQAVVEQRLPAQKEKKKWLWARKGSDSTASFATKTVEKEVEAFSGRSNLVPAKVRPKNHGGARMSIAAEEVAFRKENDFGIMESIRGWAVVLSVRVTT